MSQSTLTADITSQLPTGTWQIDPSHSSVEFSVRHAMVSKVKGRFTAFSGTITIEDDPLRSSVEASIDLASVDTHDGKRDAHLRSPDFFDVERFPTMTFASSGVREGSGGHVLTGDLALHGVTRALALDLEHNGTGGDPWGGTRTGFTATTEIDRKDFGLTWNAAIETGGVVVGEKVKITIEVEAVKQ